MRQSGKLKKYVKVSLLALAIAGGACLPPVIAQISEISQKSLLRQACEQNLPLSSLYDPRLLDDGTTGIYNDTYLGIKNFWNVDIVGNLFGNVGQVLGRWLTQWLDGWAADTIGLLTAMMRTFFLNPNIAAHGLSSVTGVQTTPDTDDISPSIQKAANLMYAIALDLLLILFFLAIWRYWTDAAWRGGLGVMGAVGRLIFTFGITLAWPTICALEIDVSNEMIKTIFFNSFDQIQNLDATMATTVRAGLVATVAMLTKSFLPTLGGWTSSIIGSTIAGLVSSVALVIFLILTTLLIVQLILILLMKAVQLVLLAAQYMFAPVFLVFFATPDTESVATSFIRSCVEVSLWTFVWVGLLKLMVIFLFSSFSPWGKIVIAMAILQLMIQAPSFLSRASISPISPIAASGLLSAGLKMSAVKLGASLVENSIALASSVRTGQNANSISSFLLDKGGNNLSLVQSQAIGLNNYPGTSAANSESARLPLLESPPMPKRLFKPENQRLVESAAAIQSIPAKMQDVSVSLFKINFTKREQLHAAQPANPPLKEQLYDVNEDRSRLSLVPLHADMRMMSAQQEVAQDLPCLFEYPTKVSSEKLITIPEDPLLKSVSCLDVEPEFEQSIQPASEDVDRSKSMESMWLVPDIARQTGFDARGSQSISALESNCHWRDGQEVDYERQNVAQAEEICSGQAGKDGSQVNGALPNSSRRHFAASQNSAPTFFEENFPIAQVASGLSSTCSEALPDTIKPGPELRATSEGIKQGGRDNYRLDFSTQRHPQSSVKQAEGWTNQPEPAGVDACDSRSKTVAPSHPAAGQAHDRKGLEGHRCRRPGCTRCPEPTAHRSSSQVSKSSLMPLPEPFAQTYIGFTD